METISRVPPGFRFHPTDEELVDYYLRKKIASKQIDLDVIIEVDLYKIEPWDLQELCKIGKEEQSEWYFFSHKDKKYPTGTRTNRATKVGFWKATGRDKSIYCRQILVGMRKTLVYYKGRAPNGQKSDWIMHEYRLETNENGAPQEEGWVVCRVFKKRLPTTMRRFGDQYDSPCTWYNDQASFIQDIDSPSQNSHHQSYPSLPPSYLLQHQHQHQHQQRYLNCKQELDQLQHTMSHNHALPHLEPSFLQLPQLESHKVPTSENCNNSSSSMVPTHGTYEHNLTTRVYNASTLNEHQQFATTTDWRVMDKFVASQLMSHEAIASATKEILNSNNFSNTTTTTTSSSFFKEQQLNGVVKNDETKTPDQVVQECASSLTSGCEINLWK